MASTNDKKNGEICESREYCKNIYKPVISSQFSDLKRLCEMVSLDRKNKMYFAIYSNRVVCRVCREC